MQRGKVSSSLVYIVDFALMYDDSKLAGASIVEYAPRNLIKQIRIDMLGTKQCHLRFKALASVNFLLKCGLQLKNFVFRLGQNGKVA